MILLPVLLAVGPNRRTLPSLAARYPAISGAIL
jgi:hypothetical protein